MENFERCNCNIGNSETDRLYRPNMTNPIPNNNNNARPSNSWVHPTCGSDLRRGTKAAAFTDSILSGFSIFAGIAVLNNMFAQVKDAESSAFSVGCMLLFIVAKSAEIYLAFRLYRAAHERDIIKMRIWKKSYMIIIGLGTVFVLILHHAAGTSPQTPVPVPVPTPTPMPPLSPYPLLWFYVFYFISAFFRFYVVWIVSAFIAQFTLS